MPPTNLEKGLPIFRDQAREEHLYTAGLAHIYKEPRECDLAEPWLRKALEKNPQSGPALVGLRICGSGEAESRHERRRAVMPVLSSSAECQQIAPA